jgi:hypothetical protein
MTRLRTTALLVVAAAVLVGTAPRAQTTPAAKPAQKGAKPAATAPATHSTHVAIAAGDLKWGPAPPSMPPGAQIAVLDGDPSKAVPFVIRGKLPDGYRVAPHWHPTDENVTVVSGTFSVGKGDTFDNATMTALTAGGFAHMPKAMHHYAMARGETIIQVHGMGPFVVNYVNPSDDPRKK